MTAPMTPLLDPALFRSAQFEATTPNPRSIATRFVFAEVRGFTTGEGPMAEVQFARIAVRRACERTCACSAPLTPLARQMAPRTTQGAILIQGGNTDEPNSPCGGSGPRPAPQASGGPSVCRAHADRRHAPPRPLSPIPLRYRDGPKLRRRPRPDPHIFFAASHREKGTSMSTSKPRPALMGLLRGMVTAGLGGARFCSKLFKGHVRLRLLTSKAPPRPP